MVVDQRVLGLKAHWLWSLGSTGQVHLFPVLQGQGGLFFFSWRKNSENSSIFCEMSRDYFVKFSAEIE